MKIRSFIIGGLAGAAIVMMIQRNQKMSAATANIGSNLKRRMNNLKDDAFGKALNMKFASSFMRTKNKEGQKHESSNEGNMEQIEQLIAQDSKVSEQVNEIMKHNNH